jgi:hypothetical protein
MSSSPTTIAQPFNTVAPKVPKNEPEHHHHVEGMDM